MFMHIITMMCRLLRQKKNECQTLFCGCEFFQVENIAKSVEENSKASIIWNIIYQLPHNLAVTPISSNVARINNRTRCCCKKYVRRNLVSSHIRFSTAKKFSQLYSRTLPRLLLCHGMKTLWLRRMDYQHHPRFVLLKNKMTDVKKNLLVDEEQFDAFWTSIISLTIVHKTMIIQTSTTRMGRRNIVDHL